MVEVLRPIIDAYLNPPLQLLREFPQPVPLTGSGNLPDLITAGARPVYGAVFIATQIPINLSRSNGLRPVWRRALMELTVNELTAGPSPPLPTQHLEQHRAYEVFRWFGPTLTNIEYWVLPGVVIEWSYLRFA